MHNLTAVLEVTCNKVSFLNLKTENKVRISSVVLGVTTIGIQIVFLREFLALFGGNEMMVSIILFIWMLLTGSGAFLGRYYTTKRVNYLFLLYYSIVPILTLFFSKIIKYLIFPETHVPALDGVFAFAVLALIPICLVSGFLFTVLCNRISESSQSNKIFSVYGLESAGSLLGGLLISLLVFFNTSSFQILFALSICNALAFVVVCESRLRIAGVILIPAIILASIFAPIQKWIASYSFPDEEFVRLIDTPYGKINVTRENGKEILYYNGERQNISYDMILNEESVHFPLLQRSLHDTILLIGGGLTGRIAELQKYNPVIIDYVEQDEALYNAACHALNLTTDSTTRVHHTDPWNFLGNTSCHYDFVLVNKGLPETLSENRFYTIEFFARVKNRLNDSGVFSFSISKPEYYKETDAELYSVIYNSLDRVFRHVEIIPGNNLYFIASEEDLSLDCYAFNDDISISNSYVNEIYINNFLLKAEAQEVKKKLQSAVAFNTIQHPYALFSQVELWFGKNIWHSWPFLLVLVLLVVLFVKMNTPSFGMFVAGFTGSSAQILLMLLMQIYSGFLYLYIGIFITVFMAGLSVGSLASGNIKGSRFSKLIISQLSLTILILIFPMLTTFLVLLKSEALTITFLLIATFIISVLIGYEFSLASGLIKKDVRKVSGELYGADMIGSGIGVFLITILFLPLFGFNYSFYFVAGLNFLGAMLLLFNRKKYNS